MSKRSLKQKREIKRREAMSPEAFLMENFRDGGYSFRPTSDNTEENNWHPNLPNDMVALKVIHWEHVNKFGIVVCGADDFRMVFESSDKETAERMFKSLPSIISQKDLRERGFKND